MMRCFRLFPPGIALLLALPVLAADSQLKVLVDTSRSPHAKLRSVGIDEVEWTQGFWADRFSTVRKVTLPLLHDLAVEPGRGGIPNFEIAAGLKEGDYTGNNWMDAWVYKWLEAAATVYAVTKDEQLARQMDEFITVIGKAQAADGYLATQNLVRNRPRFQRPGHHETYTMGHLLTAAAVHHRMTGQDNLLTVARKTGDFLAGQYKDMNPRMAHFPVNPSAVMGAVELYRVTGDPKHLELANTIVNMRGAFPGGSDQHQDRIPLREETEVMGHAVFYTYLYAGAADAFMETGDPALLTALERLWTNLVNHKMYVTGGTNAYYRGFSFRGGKVWGSDDMHEAAGPAYYLPRSPAYNETCGQVGALLWSWRMLAITGEAKFADFMEREMFNGFLPGISVTGDSFLYTNPMRWFGEEQALMANDSQVRHLPGKEHGTCCPSNVLRTLAQMQNYLYSTVEDELWIHHYSGNKFDNGTWQLSQVTDFPWDGTVQITVEKAPASGVLRLRIPAWAEGYSIEVNGKNQPATKTGTYVEVAGQLKSGDVVALELPMKVRLMRAHRKVDSSQNHVAVMRGPMVYALESPDLPDGVDISEIILPRDTKLEPKTEPEFLGGVVTLNGRALRMPKDDSGLYSELSDATPQPVEIKLIPYYAWNNRGVSQMSVWLPLDW